MTRSRRRWQKPQPLLLSATSPISDNHEPSSDHQCETEKNSINPSHFIVTPSHPSNWVSVSDTLDLAPFSRRAIIDFGNSLVAGSKAFRYLRLRNPHPEPVTVHCKRYPSGDEFAIFWLLTATEDVENLVGINRETQALVDISNPPISLRSCPSVRLGANSECLLQVIWSPKPLPNPLRLADRQPSPSDLRHVLQFRVNRMAIVEAVVVASSVKQPVDKKTSKKPPIEGTKGVEKHNRPMGSGSQCLSSASSFSHIRNSRLFETTGTSSLPFGMNASQIDADQTIVQRTVEPRSRSGSPTHLRLHLGSDYPIHTPDEVFAKPLLLPQGSSRLPSTPSQTTPCERRSASEIRKQAVLRSAQRSQSVDANIHEGVGSVGQLCTRATPGRTVSTDCLYRGRPTLPRTPENETSFISPALLSPLIKKDTTVLFNASLPASCGNIFGWDPLTALSESTELGFTRWLNHVFTSGLATRQSLPTPRTHLAFTQGQLGDPGESRAALVRLLHSPAFSAPAHRIEREVDQKKLAINSDLNFKADKGLQLRTCDLFTVHYAPVWLGLCVDALLELVQTPTSFSSSSTTNAEGGVAKDSKPLPLSKRLFSLLFATVPPMRRPKKTSASQEPTTGGWKTAGREAPRPALGASFVEYYNQQIIKRCLTLIWLLDQAKSKQILRFNPCLFNVTAPVKSSVEVCQTLGRNCLSRETNLARSLAVLGAGLSVSQTGLDEFDFTVNNLAVDLRDGLRLVKLADLLLGELSAFPQPTDPATSSSSSNIPSHAGHLITFVRYPAISRLQKIHNVRLALTAFEGAGGGQKLITATGKPITERDIVDGHRAKTLSLLWCILLRFQVTALVDFPALKSTVYRCVQEAKAHATADSPSQLLRCADEVFGSGLSAPNDLNQVDPLREMDRNQRALVLWARVICCRFGVNVANLDQSFSDGRAFCYILHSYIPTLLPRALVREPTTLNAHRYPDTPHALLLRNNMANFRLFQHRLSQLGGVPMLLDVGPDLLTNTIIARGQTKSDGQTPCTTVLSPGIVLATLAYLASRLVFSSDADREHLHRIVEDHAARIIQARWRAVLVLRQLPRRATRASLVPSSSITPLSRKAVQFFSRRPRSLASATMSLDSFAIIIQRAVRAWYRRRWLAALHIQAVYRGYLVRTQLRRRYGSCRISEISKIRVRCAVVIQCHVRRWLALRRVTAVRAFNFARTSAAIYLQCRVRRWITQRRRNRAARVIQVAWRTHRRTVAAVRIQRAVREWLNRRRERSVVRCQALARGWLARRMVSKRLAFVITVQALGRAFIARKKVEARLSSMHRAAVVIQKTWKGHLERRKYLETRSKVIRLQVSWRGSLARYRFVALRKRRERAALVIQHWWCAVRQRQRFLRQLRAVQTIQKHWRATLEHRARVLLAIQLQALSRGWLARQDIRLKSQSAVTIQRHVRGWMARRQVKWMRDHLLRVQCLCRAWLVSQRLQRRHAAATVIQRAWRTSNQRRAFLRTRQLVILVQRRWRAVLAARRAAALLETRTAAAVTIQSSWRAHLARREFIQLRAAVLTIQRAWRTCRTEMSVKREEKAAALIQRNWRAATLSRWLHRRRRAALKIQSAWRSYRVRCCLAKASVSAPPPPPRRIAPDSTKSSPPPRPRRIASPRHANPGGHYAAVARIRQRLDEANRQARSNPLLRMGTRASSALTNLLQYTSVSSVLEALRQLETATRLSREVCFWLSQVPAPRSASHSQPSAPVCLPHTLLQLFHSCNRSVPNEEIMLVSVAILLNLTEHRELAQRLDIWWVPPPADPSTHWLTAKLHRRADVCVGSIDDDDEDNLDGESSSKGSSAAISEGLCIVEYLFGMLRRLCRARPGTLSIRLFARICYLLSCLCGALPPDLVPDNLLPFVEVIFGTVQRLWSRALSNTPVRPEVQQMLRRHASSSSSAHDTIDTRRDLLRKQVVLELRLERLPSKPQMNPLVACELLFLTLEAQKTRIPLTSTTTSHSNGSTHSADV
uniref:Calponin-homology (CH) domain-containing protein n=3 Tax=Mesocestoides corti TaxID=53468 RepID=A0A5K3FUT7_MESCO